MSEDQTREQLEDRIRLWDELVQKRVQARADDIQSGSPINGNWLRAADRMVSEALEKAQAARRDLALYAEMQAGAQGNLWKARMIELLAAGLPLATYVMGELASMTKEDPRYSDTSLNVPVAPIQQFLQAFTHVSKAVAKETEK